MQLLIVIGFFFMKTLSLIYMIVKYDKKKKDIVNHVIPLHFKDLN